MPTYNTPHKMLEQAINSILAQTYKDFEFIIIDDCSTDNAYEYLTSISDKRIKVIKNEKNIGITASLNVGLRAARGKYIARMDSDDIALPERFEKQLAFMEKNNDVIVCGTWYDMFGSKTGTVKRIVPPRQYLECYNLFGNVFGLCHPSAFFRADMLRKNNIEYDENLPTAQDYGMWSNCVKYGEIANVGEVLMKYRIHNSQVSVSKRQLQIECAMRVQKKLLSDLLGEVDEHTLKKHYDFSDARYITYGMRNWFDFLVDQNNKTGIYDKVAFRVVTKQILKNKITNAATVVKGFKPLCNLLKLTTMRESFFVFNIIFKRMLGQILVKK